MGTFSTNLLLSLLAFGESAANGFDNWGESANSNFNRLDSKLGSKATISLSAGDVTLSANNEACLFLEFTGSLSGDRVVNISSRPGFWMVSNATVGDHSVTLLPSGGAGVAAPEGTSIIYSDGNVAVVIQGGNGGQSGEVVYEEAGTTLASGANRDVTGIDTGFTSLQLEGEISSLSSNPGTVHLVCTIGSSGLWATLGGSRDDVCLARWTAGTTARRFLTRITNLDEAALSVIMRTDFSDGVYPAPQTGYNFTPAAFANRPVNALRLTLVTSSGSCTANIAKLRIIGLR